MYSHVGREPCEGWLIQKQPPSIEFTDLIYRLSILRKATEHFWDWGLQTRLARSRHLSARAGPGCATSEPAEPDALPRRRGSNSGGPEDSPFPHFSPQSVGWQWGEQVVRDRAAPVCLGTRACVFPRPENGNGCGGAAAITCRTRGVQQESAWNCSSCIPSGMKFP